MKLEDFSVSSFNDTMQPDIAKQALNFCKAIILSHQKISLTLNHNPTAFEQQYITLNKNLTPVYKYDFSDFYWYTLDKVGNFWI